MTTSNNGPLSEEELGHSLWHARLLVGLKRDDRLVRTAEEYLDIARALLALDEQLRAARARLAAIEPDDDAVEALGVVYGLLSGSIIKPDGHSKRVAMAYLDRLIDTTRSGGK